LGGKKIKSSGDQVLKDVVTTLKNNYGGPEKRIGKECGTNTGKKG